MKKFKELKGKNIVLIESDDIGNSEYMISFTEEHIFAYLNLLPNDITLYYNPKKDLYSFIPDVRDIIPKLIYDFVKAIDADSKIESSLINAVDHLTRSKESLEEQIKSTTDLINASKNSLKFIQKENRNAKKLKRYEDDRKKHLKTKKEHETQAKEYEIKDKKSKKALPIVIEQSIKAIRDMNIVSTRIDGDMFIITDKRNSKHLIINDTELLIEAKGRYHVEVQYGDKTLKIAVDGRRAQEIIESVPAFNDLMSYNKGSNLLVTVLTNLYREISEHILEEYLKFRKGN